MAVALEWIDWKKVVQCIEHLSPDVCYLVLRERQGKKENQVGKLLIHPSHLARYLAPAPPQAEEEDDSDEEDEDDSDEDGDDYEDDEDLSDDSDDGEGGEEGAEADGRKTALESATLARQPSGLPSRTKLLEAASRWVRMTAESNLSFEEITRFRLRAYGPKGSRALISVCFGVKNPAWAGENLPSSTSQALVPAQPVAQVPVTELPRIEARDGAFAPYRALGQYYQQFGQVLANGYGQLQQINTAMITGLYDQLRQSHSHRDSLVTSVVNLRTEQLERAENRHRDEQSDSERNALARQALEQLGEATKAVFVSQGISPEHMEVLDSLTASPELMATLRDPRVRQLMRDPDNLRALAGMLVQVAGQAHQAMVAAQPPQGAMPGPQYSGMPPGPQYPGMPPGPQYAGMLPGPQYAGMLSGPQHPGMQSDPQHPGTMAGGYPPGMMPGQPAQHAMTGPQYSGAPATAGAAGYPVGGQGAYPPAEAPAGYPPGMAGAYPPGMAGGYPPGGSAGYPPGMAGGYVQTGGPSNASSQGAPPSGAPQSTATEIPTG